MKKLLLLTLGTLFFCAMGKKHTRSFKKNEPVQISSETFEQCKNSLPPSLKDFVTDFETWPKKDKDTIKIYGLGFVIEGLSEEKQEKYGGNLGVWIDSRTITSRARRANLITCLEYLKQ